jgi:hypothetical protein
VLAVEDVGNGTGDGFIFMTVTELLDLLRIHEESLKTRNER